MPKLKTTAGRPQAVQADRDRQVQAAPRLPLPHPEQEDAASGSASCAPSAIVTPADAKNLERMLPYAK